MPSNGASIAVLERGGFRREGLARRYIMINGVFEDHFLFARLKDDALAVVGEVGDAAPVHRRCATTTARATGSVAPGAAAEGHAA